MNLDSQPDFATSYLYEYLNKHYNPVQRPHALANPYFTNQTIEFLATAIQMPQILAVLAKSCNILTVTHPLYSTESAWVTIPI